jgi:hypothetical protein
MGNDVGNSVMSIAGIPVGAGVGLADRFIGGWMGALYGELEGNAPTGEPAGRLLGGKLEAVMGAVGFTPIGSFVAPIGAGLMLGTSRRGAAAGRSVGTSVDETSLGPLLGATEGSLIGARLGFPYGMAVKPEKGDWIGDHEGLTTEGLLAGPCTTMVGSSVGSVVGRLAGELLGIPTGAFDPGEGARGGNGCIGALVVDETTGEVGLVGLTGDFPLGLAVGQSKPCGTESLGPGGSARGARGGNGCIGALVGTTGDVGVARLTGEFPMGRTGLAVGRPKPCGTGALPVGNEELGTDATVGLASGDAGGAMLAGLLGVAVGELLLGELSAGASGTVPPLVPPPTGAAVRMVVGALGTSTTGPCGVGATGLCPIGATGLLVTLAAWATGLALGDDAVEGVVAVLLSGAVKGMGAEALDWTVAKGDNVDGAIGVRSLLRASDDKVGVDAGAMGSVGLDPVAIGVGGTRLALGAVGGTRLALVWDGAMGFSKGEAVGWNNESK